MLCFVLQLFITIMLLLCMPFHNPLKSALIVAKFTLMFLLPTFPYPKCGYVHPA